MLFFANFGKAGILILAFLIPYYAIMTTTDATTTPSTPAPKGKLDQILESGAKFFALVL